MTTPMELMAKDMTQIIGLANLNQKVAFTVYNVRGYGAKGDGVTDDTAAILAAINAANTAGGGIVFFPPGTYLVTSTLFVYSNVRLIGSGREVTIIRANTAMNPMVSCLDNKNFFAIRDLTLDFNNVNMSAETISIRSASGFNIENCYFKNISNYGMSMNAVSNFSIRNNIFERQVATGNPYNVAIVVGQASGNSFNGIIEGNLFMKSAINISGRDIRILKNEIQDWMCGAAIVTEQAANCQEIIISHNTCHGSRGTDVNAYTCGGIEVWSPYSIVTFNEIYDNAGTGIDFGSFKGICNGNIIYNNGVTVNNPGISIRYGTSVYNASESVITGNKVFDTRAAATATQTYGIAEETVNTQYVTISGNNLKGNKTGPMSLQGSRHTIHQANISAKLNWDAPSIAAGGAAENDIVLAGAAMGDFVIASCSIDTQGMKLLGRVNVANNVKIRLENGTAAAIDLAVADYRVMVLKPIDALDY